MMLKAHQSLSNKELSLRNKTMVDFYIGVIKRYRKELLKLSTLIVADAYFSTSTFVNGIKKEGFSLISRFRDNACLFYVYAGPRTGKRGRPKTKDGKIDMIGLCNVYMRLLLMYNNQCQLSIYPNDECGTTIHIEIILNTLEEGVKQTS